MKNIFLTIIILFSIQIVAQTKKFEVSNNVSGKTVMFEESQRVKISTVNREKFTGNLTLIDEKTISINGSIINLEDISSIKVAPKKGLTTKKVVMGVGLGLVASSAVLAANSKGDAFALFGSGALTTIVGGLLNGESKNYTKRKNTFKIIQ